MSILIKDMEMPKDCKYCKFRKTELQEDPDWCLISGESLFYLAENDCPLIEMPEDVQPVKHGRWSVDFCSNCGVSKYNFISFNIVGEKEYARPFGTWNYCPRCGAKMDGET